MDPIAITIAVESALNLLDRVKGLFSNTKIKEIQDTLSQKTESLESQVQQHRSILQDMLAQSQSNKHVIEEHNKVLLNLTEAIKALDYENNRLRKHIYIAFIIWPLIIGAAAFMVLNR